MVRAPDIEAKVQEQKEKLLGESDTWPESISFGVAHEMDGALAYKLLQAFGAIPSLSKKAAPVKPQNDWKGVAPYTVAAAKVLGQVAIERGSSRPPDSDELEKLVKRTR